MLLTSELPIKIKIESCFEVKYLWIGLVTKDGVNATPT